MENWRDYVGYQPINADDAKDTTKLRKAFYLMATPGSIGGVHNIQMLSMEFSMDDVKLTDEEVGVEVEALIGQFPIKQIEDDIGLARAKQDVFYTSGRGVALTNYNTSWFYHGSQRFDTPIIVCGINDKYIVLKHPNFDSYGFTVS